jgi:hypothetical protein
MYFALGAFFEVDILWVVVGAVALKRRRDYEDSEELYPDEVNEPEE